MDYTHDMQEYISTEINILQGLDIAELDRAANAVTDCRKRGGTIYTIGNGGSAATASHMVVDLGKGANENVTPTFNDITIPKVWHLYP